MEWEVFHRYNELVKQSKAKQLACPDCGGNLVTKADEKTNPMLYCFACDTNIRPGLDVYGQIRSVVSEFYV